MSVWRDLDESALWKMIRQLDLVVHSSESEPWTEDERQLGLRFFLRGTEKSYLQDFDSGAIGTGDNGEEALADLRGKIPLDLGA